MRKTISANTFERVVYLMDPDSVSIEPLLFVAALQPPAKPVRLRFLYSSLLNAPLGFV